MLLYSRNVIFYGYVCTRSYFRFRESDHIFALLKNRKIDTRVCEKPGLFRAQNYFKKAINSIHFPAAVS